MRRLFEPTPILLAGALALCMCKAGPHASPPDVASAAPSSAPPPPASLSLDVTSSPVFSLPIAAARLTGGVDVVAGLVAAEGIVRVTGSVDGHRSWSADAFRQVTWSPDAEVALFPAGDGVAVVVRGMKGTGRTLVLLGPRGEPRAEPVEMGSAYCVSSDGMGWVDPDPKGPLRVRSRPFSRPDPRDVMTVLADRRPTLVCGDHRVFVLGEGDDDLTVATFAPGDEKAKLPTVAIRDSDFGDDDEREHHAYSVGDDLGLLRVATSGAMALRDISKSHGLGPWHKLKHSLSEDDDVVAVDGDAAGTFVVLTREQDLACSGVASSAEGVRVLRVDRATGEESVSNLAAADCDHARGPFWVATRRQVPVVAWVERTVRLVAKGPPIRGLATRVLGADGVKSAEVDVQADALVDGGCDETGCFAAALLREPGGDGMRPEAISAIAYP